MAFSSASAVVPSALWAAFSSPSDWRCCPATSFFDSRLCSRRVVSKFNRFQSTGTRRLWFEARCPKVIESFTITSLLTSTETSSLDKISSTKVRLTELAAPFQKNLPSGAVFPLILGLDPSTPAPSLSDLCDWLRQEKGSLETLLARHHSILFRGFGPHVPAEFNEFIRAFGYEDASVRKSIEGSVRALLESFPEEYLWPHHEDPWQPRPIRNIFFMSETPSTQGGETTISPSTVVCDRLEREHQDLYRSCVQRRLAKYVVVSEDSLCRLVQAANIGEARSKAASIGAEIKELSNGKLWVKFVKDPIAVHPSGQRCWFNHMSWDWLRFASPKAPSSTGICYGDGGELTRWDMQIVRDLAEEERVAVAWQPGDILWLDNMLCLHGRNPYTPPRGNYAAFFR